MVAVAGDLVVAALTTNATDDLNLDLGCHRVAERLSRRLVLPGGPRLQVHVHHVRLIGEVVQVHPLKDHVVDTATGFLHQDAHVVEALVGLRLLADDRLRRRQVPWQDD